MQNRYVGDMGDFVKYGLLRAIRGAKRLGVAWYLHPDAGPSGHGRHITYLEHPCEWRELDPKLFDTLKGVTKLGANGRSVANIQRSGILGDAAFAAGPLEFAGVKPRDRKRWRHSWFDRIKRQLVDCDLVFADPDNGLVPDDRFMPTRKKSAKGIPIVEANALAEGRTAVIYHHNTMRRGGNLEEIQWLKDQLRADTMAYYWRRVSNRTFFIINPDEQIRQRLLEFERQWVGRGKLV